MSQRKYEKFEIKCKKKQTRKLIYTIYMQRILKSENLQFEKQELERKMKFNGGKNIEKEKKTIILIFL